MNKHSHPHIRLKIHPKKLVLILGTITVVLAVLHLISQYILIVHRSSIDGGFINAILRIFNMDAESSIPTWYSQTLLLIGALSAAVVAYSNQIKRRSVGIGG